MYVTNQTNYALRILMFCALNDASRSTIPRIAATYRISEAHLFKILPLLSEAGLVRAMRGRKGGIALNAEPDKITIGGVVRTTEERFMLAECFENHEIDCPLVGACRLNRLWSEALTAFLDVLDNYTLADLVDNRGALRQRLGMTAPVG